MFVRLCAVHMSACLSTKEPLNNGHNGTSDFVLLMEVVLCSEVISSIKEFNVYNDRSGTKLMVYLFTMHACIIMHTV